MNKKRVVVTGLGVIASCGIGKEAFWEAIFQGVSGIKPISLFDTSPFKAKTAGEIKDFQAQDFLGPKGLRTLDRSTKLLASATKLALDDAGVVVSEENTQGIGIAAGDTMGSIKSISDFDKDALVDGPQYVNPGFFPNTVINSPASQVAIKFNIKGFNTTISTGFSAGLDAIKYAYDFLRLGRAKIVLAGGVEELCIQTYLAFYKTSFLAGLNGAPEISCPFDKRRNGIIFGEGSAILVLEDLDSAVSRQANIYAEVKGAGLGFDSYRINKYSPQGEGLKTAMRLALKEAGLSAGEVDYLSAAANSTIAADRIECAAIKEVFAQNTEKLRASALKSMLGECFSASGSLQALAAVGAIERQMIPPTINYLEKDPSCDLNFVVNKAGNGKIDNVLINAFGPSGCNSSLVMAKFKG